MAVQGPGRLRDYWVHRAADSVPRHGADGRL